MPKLKWSLRKQCYPVLLLLCLLKSLIFASSRSPPPPPPPPPRNGKYNDDRNFGNDGSRKFNRNVDKNDYGYKNRGRDDEMNNRLDRNRYLRDNGQEGRQSHGRNSPNMPLGQKEEERKRIPMDPSRRQKSRGLNSLFGRKSGRDELDNGSDGRNFNPRQSLGSDGASQTPISGQNENANMSIENGREEMTYNPIDYQFPAKKSTTDPGHNSSNGEGNDDDKDGLPQTSSGDEDQNLGMGSDANGRSSMHMPRYESARKDAVARYSSTNFGKMKLAVSTCCVGGAVGAFVGKSMLNQGKLFFLVSGFIFFVVSFLRNDYGEMSRSLGLAFIYLTKTTKAVRKRYRTGPHVRAMCRMGKRKPFPPVLEEQENPWKYAPRYRDDPDFDMVRALLSMVMIGSFCGGNVPLIPTWMGSAAGAAAFGLFGIAKNARGDLIRTMGMRVVSLVGEAVRINSELRVASKVSRVAGKIFDKVMILDRKHRIKDRIASGASWAYTKAASTAARVQEDAKEGRENKRDLRDSNGNEDSSRWQYSSTVR